MKGLLTLVKLVITLINGGISKMNSIQVEVTNKLFGKDTRQGIHLKNPNTVEVDNAIEDAIAKGFNTIYVHTRRNRVRDAIMRYYWELYNSEVHVEFCRLVKSNFYFRVYYFS